MRFSGATTKLIDIDVDVDVQVDVDVDTECGAKVNVDRILNHSLHP